LNVLVSFAIINELFSYSPPDSSLALINLPYIPT
jgi:hypothetical protein